MSNFPTKFVERVEVLEPGIGKAGNEALARLREKGFSVGIGLTEYYAGAIGVMGYQPSIREYCPRDSSETRFATVASTEQWLKKNGGRGAFLLLQGENRNASAEGYAWAGYEPHVLLPKHEITSAYRIGERAQGQGLAKDFFQVVVSGTNTLYLDNEQVGLETWQSNKAAGIYPKIGFELINKAKEEELRPTLDPEAVDGMVTDLRLYMGYSSELLAA
jgi:hypothetical protein